MQSYQWLEEHFKNSHLGSSYSYEYFIMLCLYRLCYQKQMLSLTLKRHVPVSK